MKKLLLLIVGSLALLPGYSQSFDYNGIRYNITSESDKTCEVTWKNGISGDIIIPETVMYEGTEYSVTSIGENAFNGCSGLTSVTIPNSVTSIGEDAFYECTGLTSVKIGNSVTEIGDFAFNGCASLISINLPKTLKTIGLAAFGFCGNLLEINVDKGNESFKSDSGILYNHDFTSILLCPAGKKGVFVIPNSVTKIGDAAFYTCSKLVRIVLPNTVTEIGYGAFYACSRIRTIEIPSSVKEIQHSAFNFCVSLESVYNYAEIPQNISGAFGLIDNISSITLFVPEESVDLYRSAGEWKEFNVVGYSGTGGNDVKVIKSAYLYYLLDDKTMTAEVIDCDNNISEVIIPESIDYENNSYLVTAICAATFAACKDLKSVDIPNTVTKIGIAAFSQCKKLSIINIPNSVTEIGSGTFEYCSGLTSVTIPNSVTSIGEMAFYNCSGLTSVEIPNSVTEIGGNAFAYCSGLTSVTIPNSVTEIIGATFAYCISLTSVEIPNSVTLIGDYAFSDCSGLTSVKIPNTVTSIGGGVFANCSGLTSIEIPNSVTEIDKYAFSGCSGLDCCIVMPTQLQSFHIRSFENTPATLVFTNRNLSITGDYREYSENPTYYAAGDTYEQLRALVPAEYVFLLNDAVLDENSPVFIGANSECTWESTVDYQLASGFQFDLTLPQGLSIRNISAGENSDNPENVEIAFSQVANGDYRVICYSRDASEIGVLTLVFEFVSEGSLQRGDILCHNAVMSISDRQLNCTDQTVAVTGYNITVDLPETMVEGDSITLPLPFGAETSSVAYTWSTENPAIATVEGNETLHAKNAGVTNVMLTVEDPAFTKTFITPIEVLAALWGDVDGNGVCNVQDLVAMVNYILERNPENFDTYLADIDRNGSINVVDLTALIKIILSNESSEKKPVRGVYGRSSTSDISFGEVSATTPGFYTLPIIIAPAEDYTALQADITLPEGLTIENITLGAALKSHTLDYSVTEDNSARFIVYSTSLASIAPAEDGVLANMTLSGSPEGEIGIDDILACDTSCNGYEIAGTVKELSDTNGLGTVGSEDATFDIFTLDGVCLKRDATQEDIDALAPSLYIIGGKKVIVK